MENKHSYHHPSTEKIKQNNDFVVHIQCKVIMVGHKNIIYVPLPGFQILLWPSQVSGLVFGCLLHIYKSVENIAIKHTCTNTIINAFGIHKTI